MHHAFSSDPTDGDSAPDRSSSKAGLKKIFAAGVATVGAGVMAVNAVGPAMAATPAPVQAVANTSDASVQLTAADDPLAVFQAFVTETLVNSGYLQINATNSSNALLAALVEQDVAGQFVDVLAASASDPAATFAALLAFQTLSSETLETALFAPDNPATTAVEGGVFTRLGPELENFFTNILPDMLTYDEPTMGTTPGYQFRQGDEVPGVFTQALFEFNIWFVENALRVIQPLTPVNDLAGQLVASLPGGAETQLPALLGALSEFGATRALVGPFQTTGFQLTAILDSVYESAGSGDYETVTKELANLPVKLVNAFVNGFTPEFSVCTAAAGCEPRALEWPSQLDPGSQGGLLRYLTVDFPNSVTRILTDPDGTGPGTGTAPTPVIPDEPNVPPVTVPAPIVGSTLRVVETEVVEESAVTEEEEELLVVEEDADTDTKPVRQYKPGRVLSTIADRIADRLGFGADDEESEEAADEDADDDDADDDDAEDDDSDDDDSGSDSDDSGDDE